MNGVRMPDLSADARDRSDGPHGSVSGRVQGLLEYLRGRVLTLLVRDRSTDDAGRRRLDRDGGSTVPELDRFPERARPLTHPDRELDGLNTPDVVGIETDDGLRLSLPNNPDATLVSDVWVTIEE
ncbi:hypothetical protein ACAH01_07755 [Halomicrobium sp. HM KBTZ05]|uniref:hypothetical protein n=1 Tax=Halomicrobium sp. HM KBTZ05 TaxID=3242663 RepID=UPI0035565FD8